ncbi:hypothetical protein ABIA42_003067 [Bradyrhizobium sp. USDA 327]
MTTSLETPSFAEELDAVALAAAAAAHDPAAPEAAVPLTRPGRKTVLLLAVCALAINGAAAVYTLPSGLPSLNVSAAWLGCFRARKRPRRNRIRSSLP